jgi:hypothetical protein
VSEGLLQGQRAGIPGGRIKLLEDRMQDRQRGVILGHFMEDTGGLKASEDPIYDHRREIRLECQMRGLGGVKALEGS